ncbi:gamma carbonic anhydrase family protein [Halospeciosus flavus]|uniref:Gamma carbonic anhydrase family protein n=1 Tax=Halospeciosus flavus TaxID=3032283 RepID=A0ABD5Z845_9EURY|nr:gamma carbonic anhydrase family protein [Halospeciosus flavus]
MIRSFEGVEPDIHETAYVDPEATVIGDVTIGPKANVWPNVTLRGDDGPIVVERDANVQDNAVCHEGTTIREGATIGHSAIVHAAEVKRRAMVGMNAVVLDDAVVGEESLVGAGSVVTEGTEIPDSTLAAGTPAEVRKEVEDSEWANAGAVYVDLAKRHAAHDEVLSEDGHVPDVE